MSIRTSVAALAAALLLAAGVARASDENELNVTASSAAPDAPQAEPRDDARDADDARAKHTRCVRETGTRLPRRSCLPGRVYTQEDLRSTGRTDVGQALRMLDPSIR